MKFERKRGIDGIRIVHNWKLLIAIIILLILFGFLVYFIVKNTKNSDSNQNIGECQTDEDCVAASCCHATTCISIDKKPECKGIFCTEDCSGPLDCGTGYCGCVNGKCLVVKT